MSAPTMRVKVDAPHDFAPLPLAFAHPLTAAQLAELALCARSERYFAKYWHFTNRETGEVETFGRLENCEVCNGVTHEGTLWAGQDRALDDMERFPWLVLLKAGKLGFTELGCMHDGWVARFGHPNARVHLFSKDGIASRSLLEYVRFGLRRLPSWMRLPVADDRQDVMRLAILLQVPPERLVDSEAGANNTQSLRLVAGPDDVRTVFSYPATQDISIDQSATHCVHGDSLVLLPDINAHGRPRAMRIRNLINGGFNREVLTVDPLTEQLVSRRVTGWSMNALGGRKMYRLALRHGGRTKYGLRDVKLTGDHRVLTPDGWLRADELCSGTRVATGEAAPNARQAQMLTGCMLGDSHVTVSTRRWTTCHVDFDLTRLKARALQGLPLGLHETKGSTGRPQLRAQSTGIWAGRLRERWYRGTRRRCLDHDAIEAMGEIGLAVWFLDDGWLQKRETHGWRASGGLATNRYVEADVRWLSEYLLNLGIFNHPKAQMHGQWTLYLAADGVEELMRRIGRFIPESMARKRTPEAPAFELGAWDLGTAESGFDEAIITSWKPPAYERSVFCMDVEDTHNFVTYGGVLHNSHVDELARMRFPKQTWEAVQSTIAPGGTVHIISRGKGEANYLAKLYRDAVEGKHRLHPHFEPYTARPGRDDEWYEQERSQYSEAGIKQWAPRTWQEALSGGEGLRFKFDESVHVIDPFEIPEQWTKVTGTDYGFTDTKVSPWWTGFIALSPQGTVYLYDELYGANLPAAEQAALIAGHRERKGVGPVHAHYAGEDMWHGRRSGAADWSPAPADVYRDQGVKLEKASNDRIAGWSLIDGLLAHRRVGDRIVEPPRLYVFKTCREFLRTFPGLVVDPHRPEDIDNGPEVEDDPADGFRAAIVGLFAHKRGGKPQGTPAQAWEKRKVKL